MPAPTATAETAIDTPTHAPIGDAPIGATPTDDRPAPGTGRRRGPIALLVGLAVLSTLLLFALAVVALTDGGEAVDPDPASDAEADTPTRTAG